MQTSSAMAASQLKATLTSNPQDNTEIPSLFHTFGHNDVSSGDDDVVEVLEVNQADEYHADSYCGAAASGGRGTAVAASAARVGAVAAAAVSMSATRACATASPNSSHTHYPMSRSTHNPYVLLSGTDGTALYGLDTSVTTASNSVTGRPTHQYSFSNSTSQNPLTFQFNSSATGGETNFRTNSPSANIAGSVSQRRQPSQPPHSVQLPQIQPVPLHTAGEPADGYWRDGNPMSISSTDARLVATTTVGTLSVGTSGGLPTINVNVRQRIRATASSHASSLNTSQITMPVVQPVSSSAAGTADIAATAAHLPQPDSTTPLEAASLQSRSSSSSVRRPASSSTSSVDRRPLQPGGCPMSTVLNNNSSRGRMINVPNCAVVVSTEETDERSNASVNVYSPDTSHLQQQQQQQQYVQYPPHPLPVLPMPQQLLQQQPQPQYYGYGPTNMSPPHSLYNQAQMGYAEQGYASVPPHPNAYDPSKMVAYLPSPPQQVLVPQQQPPQQYYDPQAQQPQHIAVMQGPVAEYVNQYGQVIPSPTYYMGCTAVAGVGASSVGVPPMMPGYGYQALSTMPGMPTYGHVVQQAGYGGGGETRTHRSGAGQRQQHPQQSCPGTGDVSASSSPPQFSLAAAGASNNTSVSNNSIPNNSNKYPKAKSQLQAKQGGPKKPAAPSSHQLDGKAAAMGEDGGNNDSSASTSEVSKKFPRKQDEARFHADRSAAIQLFVVVKRKMEGKRYACPLPATAVPIGSQMLVEGDRGADLGEVLAHVSVEQMARDCVFIEGRRRAALEKMHEQRASAATTDGAGKFDEADTADLPQLTGQAALDYVLSVKDWPWLIGPATPEDVESLGPQREAERQAFVTAKPIVQQFIENRYQQRVARSEQVQRATGNDAGAAAKDDAAAAAAAGRHTQDNDSDDGEHRTSLTSPTEEELHTLELIHQVTLVDCEYQFTREKITLFVSRPSRSVFVDFRRMQRKLYRTFRCRIWIAYMDEIADDEDAPESFVFVPPPSSSAAATAAVADAADDGNQEDA
ncbi:hypothetical protein ABB37_07518 [Leptomonas pyrrhocoris]|uniref:PSP1 C-terminal domain-containing protein n=1 Tax=Leptomonas pyrrhocoris TaxID=157538 RepID=A0A0M9FV95_LEPPY|nr:hypothetical protein ABB37_07518 [Leptomonas pyrrhocoris]KPA76667.1 hypothetical protein ABB37_07518 [Leptomonas pyrrhocoris]|eukprot:XP_015655106.1 hypothetical protein ABB37_07518 [Leptomonas pyrrhocoris]